MIAVQLPWCAVPQYGVVVIDGTPYARLDPADTPPTLAALRPLWYLPHWGVRVVSRVVDPDALVDVLIPEYDDALATLAARFDVSIVEEK